MSIHLLTQNIHLLGFTFIFLAGRFRKDQIHSLIENFDAGGKLVGDGTRNQVKHFTLDNEGVNIKSFKIPVFINKIAYRYFRKSKARRSFEYAQILLQKGIGTPQPIAFYEQYSFPGLNKSYYVSEHLDNDFTLNQLIMNPHPDKEIILQQFAHFCFEMHEKGIEFLDHSAGNTLIKKTGEAKFSFYLCDLNRMRFHESMDFDLRMKNLQRLTTKEEVIKIIAYEYAKWYGKPEEIVFKNLWDKTSTFSKKYFRRKKIKHKLKDRLKSVTGIFSNNKSS